MISWVSIADLQLKEVESTGVYDPELCANTRLIDKLNVLDKCINGWISIQPKLDFVILLGDVFDSPNPSDFMRYSFFKTITKVMDAGIKLVILCGNHDTDGKVSVFDDMNIISKYNDLFIICNNFSTFEIDKVHKFMAVPFGYEKDWNYEIFLANHQKVLFGHWDVEGAKMNEKRKVTGACVTPKDLAKFKYVELGHIHLRQKYYVGSFYRNTFGEVGDHGYNYCQWENPGEDVKVEFFDSNDRPFEIRIIDEWPMVDTFFPTKDSICRLVLRGTKEWVKSLNKKEIRDKYADNVFKLQIRSEYLEEENNNKREEVLQNCQDYSIEGILNEICDDEKIKNYLKERI